MSPGRNHFAFFPSIGVDDGMARKYPDTQWSEQEMNRTRKGLEK